MNKLLAIVALLGLLGGCDHMPWDHHDDMHGQGQGQQGQQQPKQSY